MDFIESVSESFPTNSYVKNHAYNWAQLIRIGLADFLKVRKAQRKISKSKFVYCIGKVKPLPNPSSTVLLGVTLFPYYFK